MALLEQTFAEDLRADGVLATERLVLRAPRLTDVKAIATLANDLRISAMTTRIPHPYSAADAEEFISRVHVDGDLVFAITLARGPLLGLCGIERPPGETPEIGYWLGVPYWGKGYATEAVRAVVAHAFGDTELDALEAGARVSNPASRRVLEKCGFAWTGVILARIRAIGTSVPIDRFRLDRERWAASKSPAIRPGCPARAS